jgi:plasmid stabilization system protein ParE
VETYSVVYSLVALQQLRDIERFISAESAPDRAVAYTKRIRQACESLRSFPYRHRLRDDVRPRLRVVGFEGRASIHYMIDDDSATVIVLGIYYGGQDWESRY